MKSLIPVKNHGFSSRLIGIYVSFSRNGELFEYFFLHSMRSVTIWSTVSIVFQLTIRLCYPVFFFAKTKEIIVVGKYFALFVLERKAM